MKNQTRHFRMLLFSALAISGGVAGALIGLDLIAAPKSSPDAGVEALERRVAALDERAHTQTLVQDAMQMPKKSEPMRRFQIACPAPWRELGPIGQGLWGCQTPEPLPNGFHPNCNVTSSPVPQGTSARAYYERATGPGTALASARKLEARALMLNESAYQASFEHSLTGVPLRVLSTMFEAGGRVFALTCSAPPSDFSAQVSQFNAIAQTFRFVRP